MNFLEISTSAHRDIMAILGVTAIWRRTVDGEVVESSLDIDFDDSGESAELNNYDHGISSAIGAIVTSDAPELARRQSLIINGKNYIIATDPLADDSSGITEFELELHD